MKTRYGTCVCDETFSYAFVGTSKGWTLSHWHLQYTFTAYLRFRISCLWVSTKWESSMFLWFHDLVMPVTNAEPFVLYLHKYGCLYIQNICSFTHFFSLIFKLCHIEECLEKWPKFCYYCLDLIVLLLGQLGTFAMEMLFSDFEILAVLHRLILILKYY